MGLETGTYISDLVATNPVGASDPKSQGDDHIRLIKSTLLATFPNLTGAVAPVQGDLNTLAGVAAFTTNNFLRKSSTVLEQRTPEQVRSDIGADNATNLASGTVADARLASNVARKDATATISAAWSFSAVLTATDNVVLGADSKELRFGAGLDDLAIYHDGTNNYIDSNTGSLFLSGNPGVSSVEIQSGGNPALVLNGLAPNIVFNETDGGSDQTKWRLLTNGGSLSLSTLTDAGGAGASAMTISRTGTVIGVIRLLGTTRIDALDSNSVVRDGTFTPTGTNVANCASVIPAASRFIRVGSMVHVAGSVTIDPTAATTITRFRLTLPIASALASGIELSGVAADAESPAFRVIGDVSNDEAEFRCESIVGTAARTVQYTYTYEIK